MRARSISHFKNVQPDNFMDDGNDNDIETQEKMGKREDENRESTLRRSIRNVRI